MRNNAYAFTIMGQAKDRKPKRFFGRFEFAQTVSADMVTYSPVRFMYLLKNLDREVDYELKIINDVDYELRECAPSAGAADVSTTTVTTDERGKVYASTFIATIELYTDFKELVDDNRTTIFGMVL